MSIEAMTESAHVIGEQILQAKEEEIAQTNRALAEAYEELTLLYEISEVIGLELSVEAICRRIAQAVAEALEVSEVAVVLCEEDGGREPVVVTRGKLAESLKNFHRLIDQLAVRHIHVPPVSRRDFPVPGPWTLLSAPIAARGVSYGTLTVGRPSADGEFRSSDSKLLAAVAQQAAIAVANVRMYESLRGAFEGTMRALAAAIEAKDPFTRGHSENVSQLVVPVGETLGLLPPRINRLRIAALLHDIGKIAIPEQTLLKRPADWSLQEMEVVRRHPITSAQILESVRQLKDVLPIIVSHHERYDGRGYPQGLQGQAIPLEGRILAVCDHFDNLTSPRAYRGALSFEQALGELRAGAGAAFDPKVVEAFLTVARTARLPGFYSVPRQKT